jgi:hypothetical protein
MCEILVTTNNFEGRFSTPQMEIIIQWHKSVKNVVNARTRIKPCSPRKTWQDVENKKHASREQIHGEAVSSSAQIEGLLHDEPVRNDMLEAFFNNLLNPSISAF